MHPLILATLAAFLVLSQGAKLVFKGGTKEWALGSRTAGGDTVFSWKPTRADAKYGVPSGGGLFVAFADGENGG